MSFGVESFTEVFIKTSANTEVFSNIMPVNPKPIISNYANYAVEHVPAFYYEIFVFLKNFSHFIYQTHVGTPLTMDNTFDS